MIFSIDLLRTFVAVAETHSFTAASQQLNSTQSTVSQKVMRLESTAGLRLLDRGRQGIRPTEAGERLLGYARRMLALNDEAAAAMSGVASVVNLRLGLPEDFAAGLVTPALVKFMNDHPNLKLEVTSGLSRDLFRSYQQGELDVALVKQHRGDEKGAKHWPEPLCWFESADRPLSSADPLPLVAFSPNGLYRTEMMDALDRAGRRWHLVYTSSSLASLQSAIAEGLGVSLLPRRVALSGHREARSLPVIAAMEIAVHYADPEAPYIQGIIEILAAAVEGDGLTKTIRR